MISDKPLDLILHCPSCGQQHIDEAKPEVCEKCGIDVDTHDRAGCDRFTAWLNPPHKSHRCGGCNTVWRPADFQTNGVSAVRTRGDNDTWPVSRVLPTAKPRLPIGSTHIL